MVKKLELMKLTALLWTSMLQSSNYVRYIWLHEQLDQYSVHWTGVSISDFKDIYVKSLEHISIFLYNHWQKLVEDFEIKNISQKLLRGEEINNKLILISQLWFLCHKVLNLYYHHVQYSIDLPCWDGSPKSFHTEVQTIFCSHNFRLQVSGYRFQVTGNGPRKWHYQSGRRNSQAQLGNYLVAIWKEIRKSAREPINLSYLSHSDRDSKYI